MFVLPQLPLEKNGLAKVVEESAKVNLQANIIIRP